MMHSLILQIERAAEEQRNHEMGTPGDVDFQRMIRNCRETASTPQEKPHYSTNDMKICICVCKRPISVKDVSECRLFHFILFCLFYSILFLCSLVQSILVQYDLDISVQMSFSRADSIIYYSLCIYIFDFVDSIDCNLNV